jgi:hypothetical protein
VQLARTLVARLISFDIDGTLEVGEPPGNVTMAMVRDAQEAGCFIGSCSDRTLSNQQRLWEEHGIRADFTVLKHQLGLLPDRFPADEYYHVGDTDLDRRVSQQAGFHFVLPEEAAGRFENFGGLSPAGC